MPRDDRDLALEDACAEGLWWEAQSVTARAEAVTYRHAYLVALVLLARAEQRHGRSEPRLRQVMGVEAWHAEEAE